MVREVLDDEARERLASNIIGHATQGVSSAVQERVIQYWMNVDQDLGAKVAAGIRAAGGASSNGHGASLPGGQPVGSSASTGG
jgi:catalase